MGSLATFIALKHEACNPPVLYEPLSFDRVNGGLGPTSRFPVFQLLPIELYHLFTRHLEQRELAALALVDKDCLQLARSVQFCAIHRPSAPFIEHLAAKAEKVEPRSILTCIRHFTLSYTGNHGSLPQGWQTLVTGMPWLTHLDCEHIHQWEHLQSILDVAMTLPLTHLSLTLLFPSSDPSLGPLVLPQWKLKSFTLRLYDLTPYQAAFLSHIIHALPESLQTLVWDHSIADSAILPLWRPKKLPNLHTIIGSPREISASTYMGGSLRRLVMDISNPLFLLHELAIPSLRELEWHNPPERTPSTACIQFICAHPNLTSLTIQTPLATDFIENTLLPLLIDDFHSLLTLRLAFDLPSISLQAMGMISQITSLRSLWLSAGRQSGIPHEWQVDHTQLYCHLTNLPFLERLVLTRDSYRPGFGQTDLSWYYRLRMLPLDCDWGRYMSHVLAGSDSSVLGKMNQGWEVWHRERMANYAKLYFESMSRLKWCFFGQIPMQKGESGEVIVELEERADKEEDVDVLKNMFGMVRRHLLVSEG